MTREPRAAHLLSYHNLYYMQRFTREMRASIEDGSFPDWVREFVRAQRGQFPNGGAVPEAAQQAAGDSVFEKLVAPELAKAPLA